MQLYHSRTPKHARHTPYSHTSVPILSCHADRGQELASALLIQASIVSCGTPSRR